MRTFRAKQLQDGSAVPWLGEPSDGNILPLVWGVNIIPTAIYDSYDEHGVGVGEPLYYEWQAILPAEYPIPDWIQDVTPIIPDTTTP